MPRILISLLLLVHFSCSKQLSPAQRENFDQKAIVELTEALVQLHGLRKVEEEARQIAKSLVDQTRETNKEFRMSGGHDWHNFLIKIGLREKGYCYHWVPELLKALPPLPLRYFERHWGTSFLSHGRENNAVVLIKRGAPFETGIVYDAWRGVGKPFWRLVAQDKKYKWRQRFSEAEILRGEAHVVPRWKHSR